MADKILDVTGLNCPLPIMEAKKSLVEMGNGKVLQVLATDPGAIQDFEALCRVTGNRLLNAEQQGDVYKVMIERVVT